MAGGSSRCTDRPEQGPERCSGEGPEVGGMLHNYARIPAVSSLVRGLREGISVLL